MVVFAGRMIPEKRVPAVVAAVAHARAQIPQLRAALIGDGPERKAVLKTVAEFGLEEIVDVPGFVRPDEVQSTMSRALCLLLPSRREGYGLVIVEAASHGTPSIVVADSDNAAVELISPGENGFVAASAAPDDLAVEIARVWDGGMALRQSTARWVARNAERLSLEPSLEAVSIAYRPPASP